jgi:inosose dehydratase
MHALRLAGGPVSWGVDFAGDPLNPAWPAVLDGIRSAGLHALELGPYGYLPEDPAELERELARRELIPVGSFVFDDLHVPARAAAVVRDAERTARWIAGAGGSVLVVIDRPDAARAATAGRFADAARLDPLAWDAMLATIDRIARAARRHGLEPVLHPHAGTRIEFEDEIAGVMDALDVGLCLDTGHALYAGLDPVALLHRYAGRLGHLHLKDVDGRVRARGLGFWEAVAAGAFCPLGTGLLELEALAAALEAIGYHGYATIEQDRRRATPGAPADDLRRSVDRLLAVEGAPWRTR